MIMDMEEPVEVVVEMVDQEGWPTKGWTLSTGQLTDKIRRRGRCSLLIALRCVHNNR